MYNHNAFAGGVQARTVAGGTVQEHSVVTLDGVAVELTLADATTHRDGLNDAIAAVADAESALGAGDVGYHFTIGKTICGMSAVRWMLPA